MKSRLLIALLLFAAPAAWSQQCPGTCSTAPVVTFTPNPDGSQTVTVNVSIVSSSTTADGIVAGDIELMDPTGTKIAQMWQPGITLTAGVPLALNPLVMSISAAGAYSVAIGVNDTSTNTNVLWAPMAATFNINNTMTQTNAPPTSVPDVPCLPPSEAYAHYGIPADGVTKDSTPYFSVHVCELPEGYVTVAYIGSIVEDSVNWAKRKLGLYPAAQGKADCKTQCRPPTQTEWQFMQSLFAAWGPTGRVAFNGSNPLRSVFTTNADGSLDPTPVAGESVGVAATCDPLTRIPTAKSYYSVTAQTNASQSATLGAKLPAKSYAVCVLSFPITPVPAGSN